MTITALVTDVDVSEPPPAWLIVRPWQVVALSIASFGLYLLYWQFEQWSALRNASLRVPWGRHRDIKPYWRGYLAWIYVWPLFGAMRDDLRNRGAAAFHPGVMAVAYLLPWVGAPLAALVLPFPLPHVIWLSSFVPLVVVQRALNAANEQRGPSADAYAEMTALHWVMLIVGGYLVLSGIAGLVPGSR
jgi:hypothetical protein